MSKKIKFEIESGNCRLSGNIFLPTEQAEKADGRKFPAVIISHGFGSCMKETKAYADVFLESGYAAVIFDFCMSGFRCKSTGDTVGMSVLTQKQDLLNVVEYVKGLPYIGKIILAGCSQGGFVSALAAAECEADIERLILYYPALCIPDDLRSGKVHTVKYDVNDPPETIRALFLRLGKKYILDARGLDPYKEICVFRKPVFIVHGIEDDLVPISYSRKAAGCYPDCTLTEVHGDHGFVRNGFKEAQAAVREFLNT